MAVDEKSVEAMQAKSLNQRWTGQKGSHIKREEGKEREGRGGVSSWYYY